jgi:hypothetical protein
MNRIIIGIAWFTPGQWPEVQRIMEDKTKESYAEWLAHGKDLERKLKKEGFAFERVPMDLGDFEIWCKRKAKKLNAGARAEYVADIMRKRKEPNQPPEPTRPFGPSGSS